MQENTNYYWDHKKQQQVIIVPTWTIAHPCIDVVAVKDVHDIPKSIFNRNNSKRLYKNILYVWLALIMILYLKKLDINTKLSWKKFKGLWWRIIFFTYFKLSVYFIIRIVIYGFSSICKCMWRQLLSHIVIHFQHLFLRINLLFTSQRYLVSICCLCIWLHETLIQTNLILLLLPKEGIWDSMNIVSTETNFCIWSQISNIQLYSLHD